MVAILKNKMASTDREYSPFYTSFFLVMAVDTPSILFASSTIFSIECNNSEIILKIDFHKLLSYKKNIRKNVLFKTLFCDKKS